MFIAFDNVASPVTQTLQDHASARGATSGQEIALMRVLIGAALAFAVVLVLVVQRAMSAMIMRPLDRAVDCFDRIASGDLSRPVPEAGNNEIGRLFVGLRRMQERLVAMVKAVHDSTDSIDTGAREIATGNNDLSARTEDQAASLEETAASMEQLTGTVRQNADNARQASQLAENASTIATRGGEVVGQVVETMREISSSSTEVVDIIGVIEGIAFQTNILALNAAVEAARAGEQGRGFAVVASEVRALAQRSASAAKDIKRLIDESAAKVRGGAEQVDRAGATMQEILQAVSRVTGIMGEISTASDEQSRGIDQVSSAVTQMDEVTQQNAALVEQAAAAAAALKDQTGNLRQLMGAWKIGTEFSRAPAVVEKTGPAVKKPAAMVTKPATEPAIRPATKPVVKPAVKPAVVPPVKRRPATTAVAPQAPGKATTDADLAWETF
jgi:methyl-accepting chemotaxis protein